MPEPKTPRNPGTGASPLAEQGYRLPAEWEPHRATWLCWPQNPEDWPGKFAPIPFAYAEMVRRIAPGEVVRVLVDSQRIEKRTRAVLAKAHAPLNGVEFHHIPTDRGWLRDSGPMILTRKALGVPRLAACFGFDGWAKYPDHTLDAKTPEAIARAAGLPHHAIERHGRRVVLEGGAIEVNGAGTLVTTEECLLDPEVQVRNPGFTREDYEAVFRDVLGITNVLWLGRGIVGDDTHGHVDDLCRFVDQRTVVLCREDDPADENYAALAENRERLQGMRLEDGSRIEVVDLPMPGPLHFRGQRLPASYANFYVANAAVLVPTFNDPKDRLALGILSELFDRPVIGIHAVDLVWGLGTVHCLTRQEAG